MLCPTKERAEAALAALRTILDGLGLALAPAKTRIVGVASGIEGYDFLGFHHRMVPSRRFPKFRYPACWPSSKAMSRAFLRGWRQFYRYGNSARSFAKLDHYVFERMALLLSKRHGRSGRGNGMKHIIMSGNRLGLVSLAGNVAYGRTAHAAR